MVNPDRISPAVAAAMRNTVPDSPDSPEVLIKNLTEAIRASTVVMQKLEKRMQSWDINGMPPSRSSP